MKKDDQTLTFVKRQHDETKKTRPLSDDELTAVSGGGLYALSAYSTSYSWYNSISIFKLPGPQ